MAKHKKLLFSGEPPLKLSTANSIQEMIEKALESTLTDKQITLFQKRLILEWQQGKKVRREINNGEKMAEEMFLQIKALPAEKQPFAWRELGRQIYVYAQSEGKDDPIGQLIMTLYQAKNTLLVKANPPLSRQAAESYAEMLTFAHNAANNTLVSLTDIEKEEIIDDLVKNFSSYPLEQQENISQADALWGQLRYNWRLASDEEKNNFRKEIRAYLPKPKPQPQIVNPITEQADLEQEPKVETENTNVVETQSDKTNKTSSIVARILPPKFLDTVSRLRAKVGKSILIPSKKTD